jgi:uncharacterized protein (DUF1697 family)
MPRFIALLRGVNVGKGNRVPMAQFKAMLEELGSSEVVTLLNSGNAAFTSTARSTAKHASAIAAALRDTLGITTPVIVKSAAELEAVIHGNPIVPPESDRSRFLVLFAPDRATLDALAPLSAMVNGNERFVITEHAAYLHCAGGILESKLATALLGRQGRGVTSRNWATALKLGALAGVASRSDAAAPLQ